MSSFQCLQTSRTALSRVLVSPLERHEASLRRQLLLPLIHGRALQPPMALKHQRRAFVATPQQHTKKRRRVPETTIESDPGEPQFGGNFTTKEAVEKSGRDRLPKDFEIKDTKIMVMDGGVLDGPHVTRHVLARLQEGFSLRMVQPYVPARPKDNIPAQYALCKIVNKRDEYFRQRELQERRRLSKATASKTKELEVNWGIGDHDLDTKLRQLGSFLEKGMKVEVVFGHKRGKKKVEAATATALLERVGKWALEEAGAREYKPKDGHVARTARLYLEGVAKPPKPTLTKEDPAPEKTAAEKEKEPVAPTTQ